MCKNMSKYRRAINKDRNSPVTDDWLDEGNTKYNEGT